MPSPKILAKKQAQVKELAKELKSAESIVFTDFQGLTVAQDTEMRANFRKNGISYQVVKNSLSIRAMQELGIDGMEEIFEGPTALAYSTEDVVLAPRLVRESSEEFKKMSIKGGIVNGERVSLEEIMALSHVPSQDVLYGQLAFMLLYPLTALAQVSGQIAKKAEEAGVASVGELLEDASSSEASVVTADESKAAVQTEEVSDAAAETVSEETSEAPAEADTAEE